MVPTALLTYVSGDGMARLDLRTLLMLEVTTNGRTPWGVQRVVGGREVNGVVTLTDILC